MIVSSLGDSMIRRTSSVGAPWCRLERGWIEADIAQAILAVDGFRVVGLPHERLG